MTEVRLRRRDSVANRIIEYFRENPDEELTVQDAATKFGVSETAIKMAAVGLINEGVVERVKVMRRAKKWAKT